MKESTISSIEKHPFFSDRAITCLAEDRLGRNKFAERLAKTLSEWREKDSLILSIYGHWGDGKTSFKNMVFDVMKQSEADSMPVIMEFSPCSWGDEKNICEAFFKEVAIKLGQTDDARNSKKLSQIWQLYSARLQLFKTVSAPMLGILLWLLRGGSLIAVVLASLVPGWFKYIALDISLFTIITSWSTTLLQKIATNLSDFYKLKAELSQLTLVELKAVLTIELKKLRAPLIITMDDLDRLESHDLKAIFQLIRTNADFPNFVYILLFQKEVVEKMLNKTDIYNGSDYLEKFIQVPLSLPLLSTSKIYTILMTEMELILKQHGLFELLEERRWHNVFISGLQHYFTNLRDVKRFISILGFNLAMLKIDNLFQANLVDFIALEVIRHFDQSVHDYIYKNKEIFTGNPLLSDDVRKDTYQEIVKNIIKNSSSQDAIIAVIKVIFPNVLWCIENDHRYYFSMLLIIFGQRS